MKRRLFKPIRGEEWIEKFRVEEFWLAKRQAWHRSVWERFCKSYIGHWIYFKLYFMGLRRTAMIVDPLMSGGSFIGYLRSAVWHMVIVDRWWPFKHFVWRKFHKREWEAECRFYDACWQALKEERREDVSLPVPFDKIPGRVVVLGENYFKRVAEILKEKRKVN